MTLVLLMNLGFGASASAIQNLTLNAAAGAYAVTGAADGSLTAVVLNAGPGSYGIGGMGINSSLIGIASVPIIPTIPTHNRGGLTE